MVKTDICQNCGKQIGSFPKYKTDISLRAIIIAGTKPKKVALVCSICYDRPFNKNDNVSYPDYEDVKHILPPIR